MEVHRQNFAHIACFSDVEEDLLGVLDALLDLSEEQNSLTAIDDPVIVGKRNIHDGASHDGGSLDNGSHLGGVHTEDGTLGHVDDRSTHHRAEDATVGDGEGATGKILKSDLAFASLGSELTETLLKVMETIVLGVTKNRHNEAGRGRNGRADVDEITVNHVTIIDDSVDDGLLLEGLDGGLHETGHEAELDAVLLDEGILNFLAHIHIVSHIDLVESGQKSILVLGLLQSARNSLTHLGHLDAGLDTSASDLGGCLLSGRLSRASHGLGSSFRCCLGRRGRSCLWGSRSWRGGLNGE